MVTANEDLPLQRRRSDGSLNIHGNGPSDETADNEGGTRIVNNEVLNATASLDQMDHRHRHRDVQPLRRNRSRIRMDATATLPPRRSFDSGDNGDNGDNGDISQQDQTQQQEANTQGASNNDPSTNNNTASNTINRNRYMGYKSSYMYILISTIIALLAIVSPPSKRNIQSRANQIPQHPSTAQTSSSTPINNINKRHKAYDETKTITSTSSPSTTMNHHNLHSTGTSKPTNFDKLFSRANADHFPAVSSVGVEHAFVSVEQVARAAATAALSDLSGAGTIATATAVSATKDKPRLLKYATTDNTKSANGKDSTSSDIYEKEKSDNESSGIFSFMSGIWGGSNKNNKLETKQQNNTPKVKASNNGSMNDEGGKDTGNNVPRILRWFMPKRKNSSMDNSHDTKNQDKKKVDGTTGQSQDSAESDTKQKSSTATNSSSQNFISRIMYKIIDPSLLEWIQDSIRLNNNKDSAKTATYIVDKIIHSTPRILAIANLLLAGTYLLHSAVADLFLGEAAHATAAAVAPTTATADFGNGVPPRPNPAMVGLGGGVGASASTLNRMHRSGRERLGGYLLFKLLLISAVVEPDTLDLLILLSWYTLLSFLKSLSFLAGLTTAHASAAGQTPQYGVFRLLILILVCDIFAAMTCTALFHGAGWSIVILLTCDCALLAIDVFTHLTRFFQQVIDEKHQKKIAELEREQIELHERDRNRNETPSNDGEGDNNSNVDGSSQSGDFHEDDESNQVHIRSRQLDHRMELLEASNSRRLEILDNTAFFLEICALIITTAHFVHIWSLHGVTFNLVDGVLALHLHSAISAIGKKIAERRNHYRIVRDLDNYFEDVTEMELKKACAAGDVCCICLGTMSMGNVKKLGCGHIFHTNCLREVVERARSIEAARCPLCRQHIVGGSHIPPTTPTDIPQPFLFGGFGPNNEDRPTVTARDNAIPTVNSLPDDNQMRNATGQENQSERALFRFSTEGILPAWLPLPAFSFEVVRRPPLGTDNGGDNVVPTQMQPQQNIANNPQNRDRSNQQAGQSFWRRLLILAGVIPMSPEEEAAAVAQLVDMFPQYERADLLRELRERGSAEAVVDSVLAGLFTGVDRGGVDVDSDNISQAEEEIRGDLDIIY